MKRALFAIATALVLLAGLFTYQATSACHDWHVRYERFLDSEMMKLSPIVYTAEEIKAIVGEKPVGCSFPDRVNEGTWWFGASSVHK
jgi:hypothetical protein